MLGDTWEWDGATWTQVAVDGPRPRFGARMVYDSARKVVLLFGGHALSRMLGDTWVWNGVRWKRVAITGPSPRLQFGFGFDAAAGVALLHGGDDADGEFPTLEDTWVWDGEQWTELRICGPGIRNEHHIVFDSKRGVSVMFGGRDESPLSTYMDTWELVEIGIGGDLSGLAARHVRCINTTTGQHVDIPLAGATLWDCEAAGLDASPGDRIEIVIHGEVPPG